MVFESTENKCNLDIAKAFDKVFCCFIAQTSAEEFSVIAFVYFINIQCLKIVAQRLSGGVCFHHGIE